MNMLPLQYQREHGDCRVNTRTELGKWVSSQCTSRVKNSLGDTRTQLLDKLGFLWSGLKEGHAKPPPGGDPRYNLAVAAKLMFPDLTIWEAMLLGGFEEEELNVVCDKKHKWRTGEDFSYCLQMFLLLYSALQLIVLPTTTCILSFAMIHQSICPTRIEL